MNRSILGFFVGLLALVILLLMAWGWRRIRQKSPRTVPYSFDPTPASGSAGFRAPVMHLATTLAGQPLKRVEVGRLLYRNRGHITVLETGLWLKLSDQELFIPREALSGGGAASWTIDRAVGSGRLVAVTWLPKTDEVADPVWVDSYFSCPNPGVQKRLLEAITELLADPQIKTP